MTKEDIDRIASEYFDDKESEHEMEEVFDLAEKALEKQMPQPKTGHEVDEGYLMDWYISSVTDDPPVWTEEHISELIGDFHLIPRIEADKVESEE